MKFCVGDRVFANGKKTQGKYENTVNEIGVVKRVFKSGHNCYGVLFDNLTNIASEHGLYWFSEGEISDIKDMKKSNNKKDTSSTETSTNYIPTIEEIIDKKLTCVIHTATKEQAKKLLAILITNEDLYRDALTFWDSYKEDTCYSIRKGEYYAYQRKRYYEANPDVFTTYEFEDVYDRKENNNMFNIPSFKEIVDKEIECIIHTPTKELAKVLFDNIKTYRPEYNWIGFWNVYKEETCYCIQNKEARAYCNYSFYTTDINFKHIPIYEIEDIICANKSNKSNKSNVIKEEKRMNKTFEVIKGQRPNTNKGETGYIDTITTIVNTPRGRSTVTCDACDYDVYTGALVASAKIVAKNNSNAAMMYNMAIELWGTDTSKSILHALANEAFKGYFDSNYTRWRKSVAYQERLKEKATRTCPICGKVFGTIAEMEAHVEKHKQAKARREAKKQERKERREAQRRLAEMESEGRIEQYMVEIAHKKVNSTPENVE